MNCNWLKVWKNSPKKLTVLQIYLKNNLNRLLTYVCFIDICNLENGKAVLHGITSTILGGCGKHGVYGGGFTSVYKMINFIDDVVTVIGS